MAGRTSRRATRGRRKRTTPRSAIVLVAALAAFVVVLVLHRRSQPPEPIPLVSERAQMLRSAEAALRADPSIAEMTYAPGRDEWEVTPANADADPGSFARYVCFVLEAHGVARPHTSVRVIDGAALEANGFDYNAASRGALTCNERTR